MFWLRNKKNNFQLHTLIWGPVDKKHTIQCSSYITLCLGSIGMDSVIRELNYKGTSLENEHYMELYKNDNFPCKITW